MISPGKMGISWDFARENGDGTWFNIDLTLFNQEKNVFRGVYMGFIWV